MPQRKRNSRETLLILLGGLLFLPALVILAWSLTEALLGAKSRVENAAMATADDIVTGADYRLAVYEGILGTYSTAPSLANRDWETSRGRAKEVVELSPGLTALLVLEDATGRVVMGPREEDAGATRPQLVLSGQRPFVLRGGEGCPCVVLRHPIQRLPGYSVVGLVQPEVFQAVLLKSHTPGTVAALVDAKADFVGRSLGFQDRVGTPATIYVREAMTRGARGLYRGRTHEGLENYSAYVTSTASGWSAHVAVSHSRIDSPRLWLFVTFVGGALLALLAAVAIIIYALNDLAARRRADEQMLRLQKGEAIGSFANTLAHDFNNLLTVIIVNLQSIQKADAGPDVSRKAGMALEAANRGANLTQQLLSFARDGGGQLVPIDVTGLLTGVSELLRQSVGGGISLSFAPPRSSVSILANRDQMEMALLNLALNARDAMGGSGRLEIAAQQLGDRVEIAVSDNGPGIPPEVRNRLFEPFVTTKPAGKGTGLGLAQVADAAAQAGGTVRVESPNQGGASFVLSLPIAG